MGNFIYVYQTAARDILAQAGFLMLKADERNGVWVFARDSVPDFDLDGLDISFLLRDVLTF